MFLALIQAACASCETRVSGRESPLPKALLPLATTADNLRRLKPPQSKTLRLFMLEWGRPSTYKRLICRLASIFMLHYGVDGVISLVGWSEKRKKCWPID